MAKTLDFLESDGESDPMATRPTRPSSSTAVASGKRVAVASLGSRAKQGGRRNDMEEMDDDFDITSALLAPDAPSPTSTSKSTAGKQKAVFPETKSKVGGTRPTNVGGDDDDDAAFIASVMQQANVKAGVEVAKKAMLGKNKGKNKVGSGVVTGGGSFQSMGLHPSLLRSLLVRGFTTPTPIQRQAIPAIMAQPPRDVVGMARTGSGKTLAYLIPLINRLNGRHSRTFGIKSLILCPSRELAVQILRVGKEIARGWKSDPGEGQDSRGEAIRWAMIVGGESLDEQFGIMSNNPDVVIATPGRMLHLTVEMNLDLKSVEYVVFDEADRLFEMGFAEQLEEMLLRLPPTRQTLLFSATLPKKLVEFAKAGLQANPKLVRLDADSKISSDLRMAFFSVKPTEKEAALLVLLRDIIGVPLGEQAAPDLDEEDLYNDDSDAETNLKRNGSGKFASVSKARKGKDFKRKRSQPAGGALQLLPHQTIVFCATKHHVEYLLLLLSTAGYACSHIYSSLDQATRGIQMSRFRRGQTSLLIVTDVAARGIDLPVLEHVVNFDFPPQARTFVHRVGRTARAGRNGWAWSMCTNAELPYLCDLQLFLGRPLVSSHTALSPQMATALSTDIPKAAESALEPLSLHETLVLGTFPREALDLETEFISSSLTNTSSSTAHDFPALRQVAERAQQKYERSIAKASQESHRRAKEMIKAGSIEQINVRAGGNGGGEGEVPEWTLAGSPLEEMAVHDVVRRPTTYGLRGPALAEAAKQLLGGGTATSATTTAAATRAAKDAEEAAARAALLAKVNAFRPQETVFEIGARGDATPMGALMKSRRQTMDVKTKRAEALEARKRALEGQVDEDVHGTQKDEATSKRRQSSTKASDTAVLDDGNAGDVKLDLEQADENDIQGVFDTGAKARQNATGRHNDATEDQDDEDSEGSGAGPATKKARSTASAKSAPRGADGKRASYRDPNFYLSYEQEGSRAERGYSLGHSQNTLDSFVQQANSAAFDLAGDEATLGTQTQRPNVTRWDSKKKKFIQGTVGADNKKMIRTESGVRLPSSFRSGRFEDWKRERRVDMPKTGEMEREGGGGGGGGGAGGPSSSVMGLKKFRHNKITPPKSGGIASATSAQPFAHGKGRPGQHKRQQARDEVKSARQIQQERQLKQQRREKNARPSAKSGGRSKGKGRPKAGGGKGRR
ncbi:DEAD-domain-containing protein [Testicularia cyperi]|uniref:RNA helicase n=1 Tax=Testicularia cyperi TaxID=1882483 RepID=A0A317XVP0_9BASI|nr:DEAD-domain-containing protein [Testicularia cyperi]